MGLLTKIESFLNGKKTYIIAILTGVLGIIALYHPIPDAVWAILGALGLGAVRSGIGNPPAPTPPPTAGK